MFDDVKKMIIQKFNSRTNDSVKGKIDFVTKNQDVLDAIARTYVYYQNNFPEKIDASVIAGGDRFVSMLNKSVPTTMADLYLDRLLVNLMEIGNTNDAKGLVSDGGIFFSKESMDRQINKWKSNGVIFDKKALGLLQGNESIISKNLNDKVIIHELSHMSSVIRPNGLAGFYNGTSNKKSQTYASRFEEICAEMTALNITGQKIRAYNEISNGNIKVRIGGYNPESSNYAISSFVELAPFAFGRGELEKGRLIDPENFMNKLNSNYSAFARDGGTFAGRIQEDFKAITDNNEYFRIPKLQADFIKIGMNRIVNPNYQNTCSEDQFKQDVEYLFRAKELMYKRFENNKLQQTENILIYDKAMDSIQKMFNDLKNSRNLFANYRSFEEFKNESLKEFENAQRKSLGMSANNTSGQINNQKEDLSKASTQGTDNKISPLSAKESLKNMKNLFETYQININGQNVELVDRKTQKPVVMDKEAKIETIKKVTMVQKWIESAGYGLSMTGGQNEFGVDPRQYEYAFSEQALDTFEVMIDKMSLYAKNGKSFDVSAFAHEIQENIKYKYSENLVYGLLSYPNPNTAEGYQKITDGVPQKTKWQYNAIKNVLGIVCQSNDLQKSQSNSQTIKKQSHEVKFKNVVNEQINSKKPSSIHSEYSVISDNKQDSKIDSVKTEIQKEDLKEVSKQNIDKDKASAQIDNNIHPQKSYSIYKGMYNGKFDKIFDFLDNQVVVNENLLNKHVINKPFVNMNAIYSMLLDKCKTQSDYSDLKNALEGVNELGGIATGYFESANKFLSKINITSVGEKDIQEMKQYRQNTIDNINQMLSSEALYDKLNLSGVINEIKEFEKSPSVQAKDRVSLLIRHSISKCQNQSDFDFLNDCIDRISPYALYTDTFVTNADGLLKKELNSAFDETLLRLNSNSIVNEEKIYKDNYGKEIQYPSNEQLDDVQQKEENNEPKNMDEQKPTKSIETEHAKQTEDKPNMHKKFMAEMLACEFVLKKGEFYSDIPIFKNMNDLDNFINITAPASLKQLKDDVTPEDYDRLFDNYQKVLNMFLIAKKDMTKDKSNNEANNKLVVDIENFINETKSKINGANGAVEFDADYVEHKTKNYLSLINSNRANIDNHTLNRLENELNNLLHVCSMSLQFNGGM